MTTTPKCQRCNRTLLEGESAWADEVKVIDVSGRTAKFRLETRYTCDGCDVQGVTP